MQQNIDFEDTATYLLSRVAIGFRAALERHLGPTGIHAGQAFILIELWREDGLRPGDLAQRIGVKAPTVNGMIKGLEQINLVKTRDGTKDGRTKEVYLTERGRHIRSEVEKCWIDIESEYAAGLNPTDRTVLKSALKKLMATYVGKEYVEDEF